MVRAKPRFCAALPYLHIPVLIVLYSIKVGGRSAIQGHYALPLTEILWYKEFRELNYYLSYNDYSTNQKENQYKFSVLCEALSQSTRKGVALCHA